MTLPTSTERGVTHSDWRGWQALCHEVIGLAVDVETAIDRTLAVGHAKSSTAAETLFDAVFPKIGVDVKRSLLTSLLRSTRVPGSNVAAVVYLPFCDPGIKRLIEMRNDVAHSAVDHDSTNKLLKLTGRRRGQAKTKTYRLGEIERTRRIARAVRKDLAALAQWAAAPDVVNTLNFDDWAYCGSLCACRTHDPRIPREALR